VLPAGPYRDSSDCTSDGEASSRGEDDLDDRFRIG
jgi:hypothetical protein